VWNAAYGNHDRLMKIHSLLKRHIYKATGNSLTVKLKASFKYIKSHPVGERCWTLVSDWPHSNKRRFHKALGTSHQLSANSFEVKFQYPRYPPRNQRPIKDRILPPNINLGHLRLFTTRKHLKRVRSALKSYFKTWTYFPKNSRRLNE
jgi:hypothetical protein